MIATEYLLLFQGTPTPPAPVRRRSLRDIALRDRQTIVSDPMGVAEDVLYFTSETDDGTPVRGVWLESPNDARNPYGVGVEANVSRAWLDIALTAAPTLQRSHFFVRVSTGERWNIDQKELFTGFGWHLTLDKPDEALGRGAL